ncbi:hypothetical protein AgCh_019793 [Apium graveolens]
MGVLDHFSDLCSSSSTRKSKRKPMQTVDIKVKMDCDGCERRVKNSVSSMKGLNKQDISGLTGNRTYWKSELNIRT